MCLLPLDAMMRTVVVAAAVLTGAAHAVGAPRKAGLLELQRTNRSIGGPAAFAGPVNNGATLNLKGFCKGICDKPPCAPVCTEQPCCCWSTFASDKHPAYPTPSETTTQQQCLNAPKGFRYTPEPGLTFDDGYMDTLKQQALPVYDGRRLCCLRRAAGVQEESQRDLTMAVPTTTTTAAAVPVPTTTPPPPPGKVPEPDEVPAAFTTKTFTTSLLSPGDEYETAQMEEAARAHMSAAKDLQSAVASLTAGATAIGEVNDKLQTDPNLVRSRKHVAEMKSAIRGWAVRRWANLKRLKTGDASAFDDAPKAPPGLA